MIRWFLDVLGQMVITHVLSLMVKGAKELKKISEKELSQHDKNKKIMSNRKKNSKILRRKKSKKNLKNRK